MGIEEGGFQLGPHAPPTKYATSMSSHGVSLCCLANDFSGSSRASMSVPSTVSITMRFGSKIARLSCPEKSTVRRSLPGSGVNTTFLRESPLPLTNQIAPVIDAPTLIAFTLFQRSRPPCALTAKSNKSLLARSVAGAACSTGWPSLGSETVVAAFISSLPSRKYCSRQLSLPVICPVTAPAGCSPSLIGIGIPFTFGQEITSSLSYIAQYPDSFQPN